MIERSLLENFHACTVSNLFAAWECHARHMKLRAGFPYLVKAGQWVPLEVERIYLTGLLMTLLWAELSKDWSMGDDYAFTY